MTPKARRDELIAVRVLREQRWAYEARLAHLSYREMRTLVNRPESEGGLGYDLSEQALRGLVNGYLERMADVEAVNLDEHRARELNDLDLIQRETASTVALANERLALAAALEMLDVDAAKLKLGALDRYRAAGESRRKLLGLDAPQRAAVDVTVHDAVVEELDAMLNRRHAEEPST